MGSKDFVRVLILVGFFVVLGLILFFTVERPSGPGRSIENNVIIEERMKRLQNQ